MKKLLLGLLLSSFLFAGCVSTKVTRVITGMDVEPILEEAFPNMENRISRGWHKKREKPSVIVYFCYDERFGGTTDVTVISNWIQTELEARLIDSGNYKVIDRSNLDRLVKEQKFQQSGLIDDRIMVDMGRQLGGNFMINSKINKYEQLEIRVTNVESAELVYVLNKEIFEQDTKKKRR